MTETPINRGAPDLVLSTRRESILRTSRFGTPYRTPNVRRFGPTGATWRTSAAHSKTTQLSARRTSTPLNTRTKGQRDSALTSTPLNPRAKRSEDETFSQITSRTEIEENNIKQLMGKLWQVFRLTPLYNFKTAASDLSHFSRTLSSHISAETKKGVYIDVSEPGDAKIGLFSGLDTGIDDSKALLIQIKGKKRYKTEEKVLCEAVLFSTDLEYNPLKQEQQSEFTYFSTALIHGPVVLSETLQNWLEVQFDCKVMKQKFSSHELAFMAAMFTGYEETHKPLDLVYGIPAEVKGISQIDYSTQAQDCLRLWKQIRSEQEDAFTDFEASLFIAGLETHFYEIFNIKLERLPLKHMTSSVVSVNTEGKLKLFTKSSENVLKVLRHLTDLALDQLKIA
ncbi:centromere protein L-like [Mya arenaria]|uniref:centromere protein L-like n=1 Tax=Mya arenaria TaxID=6604 RepID=UPI0022E3EDB4|nr:centromere protein L-like [Mya arenaria]XP_052817360.1 centromere protein L-like [Mya arenaria]XP_052817362.1 centromere protein L-like [Mya arenaria]